MAPVLDPTEINDNDTPFSFGDWYRMDAAHASTTSMLTSTSELGGRWVDRVGHLTVKTKPQLDSCGGSDKVDSIDEKPSSVWVDVEMAARECWW